MTVREAHRRRVAALERAAAEMILRTLGAVLDRLSAHLGAVTAAADPNSGEAQASVDDLGSIPRDWTLEVRTVVGPWFGAVFEAGAQAAEDQVAALGFVGLPPNPALLDEAAAAYLAAAENRFYRLGETAWENARTELLAGFRAGEGIDALRRRVRSVTDLSRAEAEAVARTEVIAASNLGADARISMMGTDAPPYKQWLATLDDRTRPTHAAADGQVVPRTQPFAVGGSHLQVPGDPTGPPGEVINCRCTVLYTDTAEALDVEGRGQGGIVDEVADTIAASALGTTAAAAALVAPPQVDSATGEVHTGAMIALVPADPAALALPAGEPAAQLHLTLGFLGEAADIPPLVQAAILDNVSAFAAERPPVYANAFGATIWNPGSDSVSLNLSVGGPDLVDAQTEAWMAVERAAEAEDPAGTWTPAENHVPWVPHICLAYNPPDPNAALGAALTKVGPVAFDRIRVAFGGDAHDFPLAATAPTEEDLTMRVRRYAPPNFARGGIVPASASVYIGDDGLITPLSITLTAAASGAPATGTPAMPEGYGGPSPQPGEHVMALMHTEGESTGFRTFTNLDVRPTPFAFHWAKSSSAHGGTPEVVPVGNVVRVVRDGPKMYGFATLDLGSPDGVDYARRAVAGFERWVSIGLDETASTTTIVWPAAIAEDMPMPASGMPVEETLLEPEQMVIDGGRVGELTAVSVPAQADATSFPTPELCSIMGGDAALVASVVGSTDLPVGSRTASWDGAGAADRVFSKYTDGSGNVDSAGVARAFLYRDPEADPTTKAAYKLGFADVVDGNLTIIPAGVAATAGGRGVNSASIPAAEKDTIRNKICSLYTKIRGVYSDWPDCPFGSTTSASIIRVGETRRPGDCGCGGTCDDCSTPTVADRVAAITAAAYAIRIPDLPPASWFREPDDVPIEGAFNVSDEGRVYGLLAPLGTGHRAYANGRRLEAPFGNVDYSRFLGAWALTDAGKIPAGPITMDCGHAPRFRADGDVAPAHYDNACSIIGAAAVGESRRLGGVWIAGALLPGVTPDQIARALACRCSGDWQPHPDKRGWTELIACLLVPSPGFGSAHPDRATTTYDDDGVLVASSAPVLHRTPAPPARNEFARTVRWLADSSGRSPAARVRDALR